MALGSNDGTPSERQPLLSVGPGPGPAEGANGTTSGGSRSKLPARSISEIVEPYTKHNIQVMSDLHNYPIPHPYPRKPSVAPHHTHPFSFFTELFVFRGTALGNIWPQLTLALASLIVVKLLISYRVFSVSVNTRVVSLHGALGSVLAFVTAFRLNRSYESYVEGRKLLVTLRSGLKSMIMDMYINDPKQENPEDDRREGRERVLQLAEAFRRKTLILYSFIRQSVREAKDGFVPTSDMAGKPFNAQTYHLDPTRPRLVDLLTPQECEWYSHIRVEGRPPVVVAEMKALASEVASVAGMPQVRTSVDNRCQDVLLCWNGMLRLMESQIPVSYGHIINLLIFLFVFASPFIYSAPDEDHTIWDIGIGASVILGLVYYGVSDLSNKMLYPFGWDQEDHDLETFGIHLAIDGLDLARTGGMEAPRGFIRPELMDGCNCECECCADKRIPSPDLKEAHKSSELCCSIV